MIFQFPGIPGIPGNLVKVVKIDNFFAKNAKIANFLARFWAKYILRAKIWGRNYSFQQINWLHSVASKNNTFQSVVSSPYFLKKIPPICPIFPTFPDFFPKLISRESRTRKMRRFPGISRNRESRSETLLLQTSCSKANASAQSQVDHYWFC